MDLLYYVSWVANANPVSSANMIWSTSMLLTWVGLWVNTIRDTVILPFVLYWGNGSAVKLLRWGSCYPY